VLTRAAIRSAAETFWAAAGGRSGYGSPVRIDLAVMRSLPIAIHRISGLTTRHVESLLATAGASVTLLGAVRSLRGCLIADVGVGLILVDGDDPEAEQRLTVSHEAAHFLLHYLALRAAALTGLGSPVVAVLDRTRSPTQAELFSAALRDLPLTPFKHAMVRGAARPRGPVATMEVEADDLAIELLAPWHLVRALERPDAQSIASRFGLPSAVAARLAAMAVGSTTEMGVTGLFGIR
jgi:Zn-dependent peptidase ImmA (M78 family)